MSFTSRLATKARRMPGQQGTLRVEWRHLATIYLCCAAVGLVLHGSSSSIVNLAQHYAAAANPPPLAMATLEITEHGGSIAAIIAATLALAANAVYYTTVAVAKSVDWTGQSVAILVSIYRNAPDSKYPSSLPRGGTGRTPYRIAHRVESWALPSIEAAVCLYRVPVRTGWIANARATIASAVVALLVWGTGNLPYQWTTPLSPLLDNDANLPLLAGAVAFLSLTAAQFAANTGGYILSGTPQAAVMTVYIGATAAAHADRLAQIAGAKWQQHRAKTSNGQAETDGTIH